jgi:hypothetical protein
MKFAFIHAEKAAFPVRALSTLGSVQAGLSGAFSQSGRRVLGLTVSDCFETAYGRCTSRAEGPTGAHGSMPRFGAKVRG